MAAFTPVVQADFGNTPIGQAPAAWTDITRFARLQASPAGITRWRQDELAQVAPSTLRLTLDNADVPGDATAPNAGRFTPGNSGSPWASGIVPCFRIRVGVTIAGTTYWRFDGYVDPIEAAFVNGDFPVATLAAQDWLAWAGRQPLRTMLQETILHDPAGAPLLYLPLTDDAGVAAPSAVVAPAGTALSMDFGGTGPGSGTFAFGSGSGPAAEGTKALTLSPVSGSGYAVRGDSCTFSFSQARRYVRINATFPSIPSGTSQVVFALGGDRFDQKPQIYVQLQPSLGGQPVPGALAVNTQDAAGSTTSFQCAVNVCDGLPHDIVLEMIVATSTINVYVDGVLDTTHAASVIPAGVFNEFAIGSAWTFNHLLQALGVGGTFSHFAVYDVPSAINIADQLHAGTTGFAGETTGAHVARLLGFRPNNGSVLDTGQGTVGLHQISGVTLQQALLDTAKAEGGIVYVDGQGRVVFLGRQRLRDPAVSATLDITLQQTTADLTYRLDTQLLRNDVTITRQGGVTYRAQDTASQNGPAGDQPLNDTYILGSDLDVKQAASFLLANQKTAAPKSPAVAHDVLTEPTQSVAVAVLNLTPAQRISLINPPTGTPTVDVLVQGSQDSIGIDEFTVSFNTSNLPRQTLRFDAAADAFTKLDSGNVFAW